MLWRALLEAHQLDAAFAQLHLATVQQADGPFALVAVVGVAAVRAAEIGHDPGAGLPLRARVRARARGLRDTDVLIGAAPDRDLRLFQRKEPPGELLGVVGEGDQ